MIVQRITYGPGGYDPALPNNNVISSEAVEYPDPPITPDPIDDLIVAVLGG